MSKKKKMKRIKSPVKRKGVIMEESDEGSDGAYDKWGRNATWEDLLNENTQLKEDL